jgi:hypothetical protein
MELLEIVNKKPRWFHCSVYLSKHCRACPLGAWKRRTCDDVARQGLLSYYASGHPAERLSRAIRSTLKEQQK